MRTVLLLAVLIISCLAAPGPSIPGERVRRHLHDIIGPGGYGGYGVGGGQHGGGGYGLGSVAIPAPQAAQSYSRSSASSSSVSSGGTYAG